MLFVRFTSTPSLSFLCLGICIPMQEVYYFWPGCNFSNPQTLSLSVSFFEFSLLTLDLLPYLELVRLSETKSDCSLSFSVTYSMIWRVSLSLSLHL